MPVAVTAAASAIALPRSRTSTIACSAVITRAPAAAVSSPTEWPATTLDLAERVGRVREDPERGDQPGRHQQRLRDLGAPDLVGIRLGAEVDEVERGHRREPLEPGAELGILEPRVQEAGTLGALSGRDDGEHGPHSALPPPCGSPPPPTKLPGASL